MTSITIGLLLKNLWPQCHCSINNCKPKGDKRHKVIKLIRPVHNQTQHHHKEVKPEENLKDRHIIFTLISNLVLCNNNFPRCTIKESQQNDYLVISYDLAIIHMEGDN